MYYLNEKGERIYTFQVKKSLNFVKKRIEVAFLCRKLIPQEIQLNRHIQVVNCLIMNIV